jgi:hypothetical protein
MYRIDCPLGPKPFLFFDEAITFTCLPFLIPLIVQEVLEFLIVQDLPPADTLLPVILDPPFAAGKEILTVRLTLPFLGLDEEMEITVGADGLDIFSFEEVACAGAVIESKTSAVPSTATTNFFIESSKSSVDYRLHQLQVSPIIKETQDFQLILVSHFN